MLDNEGYADLPLVDPACAALNYARLLVTCGLKQSKLTYGTPPTSARRKW
jgi:hypothetical protein